ncbi:MAG TPA: hypothetical protein VKR79_05475 [Gaiellaceae bacterium]|nr:hypothetical protein [Gaiellaceae bacterium]
MALARVVSFDGVGSDHMAEMAKSVAEGEPPEGLPATEMILLHDPDTEQALAIVFFDNEGDYATGHEILDAMPTGDTPGQRTSVTKYHVAGRMSP